jgi:hypothetical protein
MYFQKNLKMSKILPQFSPKHFHQTCLADVAARPSRGPAQASMGLLKGLYPVRLRLRRPRGTLTKRSRTLSSPGAIIRSTGGTPSRPGTLITTGGIPSNLGPLSTTAGTPINLGTFRTTGGTPNNLGTFRTTGGTPSSTGAPDRTCLSSFITLSRKSGRSSESGL